MHLYMLSAGSLCLQGNCSVTSSGPSANVCNQSDSVAPSDSSVLFTCGLTVVGGNITCMANAQSSANVGYATAPRSNSGLTANSVITQLGSASNVAANFNNGVVSVGDAISSGTSTAVNGASSVANEVSTVCICLCGQAGMCPSSCAALLSMHPAQLSCTCVNQQLPGCIPMWLVRLLVQRRSPVPQSWALPLQAVSGAANVTNSAVNTVSSGASTVASGVTSAAGSAANTSQDIANTATSTGKDVASRATNAVNTIKNIFGRRHMLQASAPAPSAIGQFIALQCAANNTGLVIQY